ncbi:PfkB family carbohydrate kinase [Polynucleobacter sp. AP-Melu-500A-A1]|uniref:PfkB family carbohydrate kinase n=1 Tax=Polynucleobacter sp. AP-Melu-500A-A1 TaxID=2576929 RepID=UPI001C0B9F46|nr:PfkB family carbohydrate kinase [Polynucleobacter sp. AP-Melu-500A-A1]MBU3630061.1 adenylyltransferase/cytidyltransferase family protein [Polynucleobacter sp. AP-Melu-500A-A1]
MNNNKIVDIEMLGDIASKFKAGGKRIVLCHGAFDLLHTGHIRHLQSARQSGDVLIVTTTADQYIKKGPGRPVFNEHLRAENLAALECVDYVAIIHGPTAEEALKIIKPAVYAKGSDYKSHTQDITGNIVLEQTAVEKYGGKILFTDEITFSSSNLLNAHFDVFTPEIKEFLLTFKVNHSENLLKDLVSSLSDLNVLVVGDSIIDEYQYCSPLGQTGKGNFHSVRYESKEKFAGGSVAVANHVANFAKSVTLLSGIGNSEGDEAFILKKLSTNINPKLFKFNDAPTVKKTRFVGADLEKLFEVYFINENAVTPEFEREICSWIKKNTREFDLVIIPDFGNGLITPEMARALEKESKFLAVNTQINSGNRGFHVINKYLHADFISLNEPELRLATHNKTDSIESLALEVCEKLGAQMLAVTRGKKGVMIYDKKQNKYHNIPALATKVIDRVGAGDAFLAVASMFLAKKLEGDIVGFMGSISAALDVQIICNRESVNSIDFQKYLTTLMK